MSDALRYEPMHLCTFRKFPYVALCGELIELVSVERATPEQRGVCLRCVNHIDARLKKKVRKKTKREFVDALRNELVHAASDSLSSAYREGIKAGLQTALSLVEGDA